MSGDRHGAPAVEHPRVLRRRTGSIVAGVGGGVADHLGTDPFRVRLVLTVLCALGGAGLFVYVGLWMFCPLEPAGRNRTVDDRERWQAVGMVVLGVGLAALLAPLDNVFVGWIVGPLGVVLVGAAVVWREADGAGVPGSAGRALRAASVRGRGGALRAVVGALLVTGGIVALLLGSLDLGQLQFGLLAALATLVGVVVLTLPWWLRLVRELGAERRARIRVQERDEIAAHLHDSVLQTLALIQKQSGDDLPGREVRRLARRQERELRAWLHTRTAADGAAEPARPAHPARPATVAAALGAAAAEVEDDHGVRVAPVLVGDAPLGEGTTALVAAAREAMVNAAKHSGADEISVYAEVEPDEVAVFVRDRGVGFDPDAIGPDRRGLAGSVHARMARHGGRVRLRTAPGEGTEIELTVSRGTTDRVTTDRAAASRATSAEETT